MDRVPHPLNEAVRARFKAQKTRDTTPEVLVRRLLHKAGARYRLEVRAENDLRTKPDIVFRGPRLAVYIDGCFWHGCPEHFIPPKNNAAWWQEKISANKTRDGRSRRALADRGWTVLSFWEHDDPSDVAQQVLSILAKRRRPTQA